MNITKKHLIRTPTLAWQCLALLLPSVHLAMAGTVYNSFDNNPSTSLVVGDFGNTVTLAGPARYVTSITVGLTAIYFGDSNLQMQLFTADGPGGSPGTLLWQSGFLHFPIVDGQFQNVTFAVPLVHVPDTLVWDLSTQNGIGQGGTYASGTSVGSSGNGWAYLLQPQYTSVAAAPFMADIQAVVPEPSLASLLVLGATQTLLAKSRSRRAIRQNQQDPQKYPLTPTLLKTLECE